MMYEILSRMDAQTSYVIATMGNECWQGRPFPPLKTFLSYILFALYLTADSEAIRKTLANFFVNI